ncbi:hypothetical protein GCM10022408_36080 [Hymenobacter fastidiosus]|uniref:Carboxypeptidase-like regulatory domain-containing protein n=2 Tax=Hymenobacter fastidiosus TaxID=486264 RepID=A0ABP7SZQ8_9BACT
MTPQGAGRHCASCQTVVIDFSRKTDAEILAVLSTSAGRVCGRFGDRQLNRTLRHPEASGRAGWWRAAVAATVALLGLRELVAPAPARAQTLTTQPPGFGRHSPEPEFVAPRPAPQPDAVRMGKVSSAMAGGHISRTQISGKIIDGKTGEGLPGVTVLLQGTQHGVSTSFDGSFTLSVEKSERHCAIMVSSIGYITTSIPQPTDNQPVQVGLAQDYKELSGLIIVNWPIYTPRGVWGRLRSIPHHLANLVR